MSTAPPRHRSDAPERDCDTRELPRIDPQLAGIGTDGGRGRSLRRRSVRLRAGMSEAWRNLASGTTRATMWALLLTAISGALVAADVAAITEQSRSAIEFRDSAAATYVIKLDNGIDGARCHNLGQTEGVLGAAAVREAAAPVTDHAMPGTQLPSLEVTPGIAGVLGITPQPGTGVLVTDSVAAALDLTPGEQLATTVGSARVAGVYPYPEDGRVRDLGYRVLQPVAPTGKFSACWLSIWPYSPDTSALLRTTISSTEDNPAIEMTQANGSLGNRFDASGDFDTRPTAFAWRLGAAIGAAIGFLATWIRRLEHAGTLHAGIPKRALGAQVAIEALAWVGAAVLLAATCAWLLATHNNPDPPWPALYAGLRIALAAGAGAVLGTLLAAAAITERRLFRYFKAR